MLAKVFTVLAAFGVLAGFAALLGLGLFGPEMLDAYRRARDGIRARRQPCRRRA